MKHFLTTTALVAALSMPVAFSTAAFAESHTNGDSSMSSDSSSEGSMSTDTAASSDSSMSSEGSMSSDGAFTQYSGDPATTLYGSDLMGARIYATENEVGETMESGAEQEWNDLGEINDMIVSPEGQIDVVILGIGGFLGIGERDVAVNMSDIQIVRDGANPTDYFLVINASQEAIENAPEFQRPEMNAEATGEGTTGESTGMTDTSGSATMDNASEDAATATENAAENTEQAAEDAANSAENAADTAAQEAGDAAQEAGQAAEEAGDAAEDAAEDATSNN